MLSSLTSSKSLALTSLLCLQILSFADATAHRKRFPHNGAESSINAGQLARNPNFVTAPASNSACPKSTEPSDTFKTVGYFVNWGVYNTSNNYKVPQLPADKLSHVMYAFAMVDPTNGTVYLNDPWADIQMTYPKDPKTPDPKDLYGSMKQLGLLKKTHRQMKVVLSVGGYSGSPNMSKGLSTQKGIDNFVNSSVQLVEDLGLDGLDLDWEYFDFEGEDLDANAQTYVKLVQQARTALDQKAAAATNGTAKMVLTIASPAAPNHSAKLHLKTMSPFLDFFNVMAYDFTGNWSTVTGHAANLYLGASNSTSSSTPFCAAEGIEYYLSQKVPPSKIVLGMPLYGRAFANTIGGGKAYKGLGQGQKPAQEGLWDYKMLPRAGAREYYDDDLGAAWTYDNATKTWISYDNVPVAVKKSEYIYDKYLGGAMWWSVDGDRKDEQSMISTVVNTLETVGLKKQACQNRLRYPNSKYSNVRSGFKGE